jgi:hypothetical protein
MGRLGHISSSLPLKRELFPSGFAGEVMQHIYETWQSFVLHKNVRLENRITAVFCDALIAAYDAAGRSWFIQPETPITDPTFGTEEGRNDMRFFPPQHYGQKVFFTIECKRLHVTRKSGFVHLADAYVKDGVQRFVNGQYSSGLPCGGMVGYVMDNRMQAAFSKVQDEIRKYSKDLRLVNGKILRQPSFCLPECTFSADTIHTRPDGNFTLHHVLLGVLISAQN